MNNKRAFIAAATTLIVAFSVAFVPLAYAQTTISKPAVPEFTVQLEVHPYDVPPVFGVDEYTGKNVTLREGVHVENQSVIITIKNLPFPGNFNGTNYYLSFNVQAKGHFGENWVDSFSASQQTPGPTVITSLVSYPPTSQVDFRVQAKVTHNYDVEVPDYGDHAIWFGPPLGTKTETRTATDGLSDWSQTQTITIPETSPSISPSPSPSPSSIPSSTEIPSEPPTLIPTESPTLATSSSPSLEPSPTPSYTQENFVPLAIAASLVISVIVIGLLVILAKRRGWK